MFDLDVVSHMHTLGRLPQLAPPGSKVIPHASVTFLEELSGLYRQNNRKFFEILDWYRSHTWGRLMKPWATLVREETEIRKRALTYSNALEPSAVFLRVVNTVSDGGALLDELHQSVACSKEAYKEILNQASEFIRDRFREDSDDRGEIKSKFRYYRKRIPELMQSWGEHRYGVSRSYNQLPHFQAFFSCWYVKHFLACASPRKHKGSDIYDHGYYIEATTLGNLVTRDKTLRNTIKLIPGNRTRVYSEDEWIHRMQSLGAYISASSHHILT